jgi:hypothetical protein
MLKLCHDAVYQDEPNRNISGYQANTRQIVL